jgi:hypothetical protein
VSHARFQMCWSKVNCGRVRCSKRKKINKDENSVFFFYKKLSILVDLAVRFAKADLFIIGAELVPNCYTRDNMVS